MALIGHIKEKLRTVADPGTTMDVMSMGIIKNITVDEETGVVSLTFAPSSPVCPMAFRLGAEIKSAVDSVEGVSRTEIKVLNYNRSDELERVLRGE